ncbi:uncharacterized hydrophobic domain-containing protein [Humidesulfovibrio mexicanus]|uniref:Uncharacterized hydrophobic domain-containing protein n=1 Tax=Humidesulfovibrio mexicanus TaxID=147047 RepID=A0A239BMG3_9BACT|nr:DUF389 domain-containing protein [Humidesulfovibrio mexicanus]SNS09335.1 uncharacterized hydrophobic domain-containing protein [Humidesulfovibrio mexicanus]
MANGAGAAGGRSAFSRLGLLARFSLLLDKADDRQIDEGLRAGAQLKGATPWILMLAIFVASIGLNTNSTAVIIGAMLISPLMGPIMGIGYGVGIYDFELVRRSFAGLGVATGISLATSALYFSLSPLTGEQSELLARTSPSIWDVQIALFGGLAGIIGSTRKEKSNVIPGVAIATALMPPLCTAGFGLAKGNWAFFFGAFYLFAINSVFIALATTAMTRALNLPRHTYVDKAVQARVRRLLVAVALLTALPSVYLAWRMVGEELFSAKARAFIAREFAFPGTHLLETSVSPKTRELTVTLVGEPVAQTTLQDVRARLSEAGLAGAALRVFQTREPVDVLASQGDDADKATLLARKLLAEREAAITRLKGELAARDAPWLDHAQDMASELAAQWPGIKDVVIGAGTTTETVGALGEAAATAAHGKTKRPATPGEAVLSAPPEEQNAAAEQPPGPDTAFLSATMTRRPSTAERKRMEAWFQARTKAPAVRVQIGVAPPPRKAKRG